MMYSPHAVSSQPSIAVEINAATKKLHNELNKLIIERLPYGLPPHTRSPARYAIGLNRFAAVYAAFEKELDQLAHSGTTNEHDEAVRTWVLSIVPEELRRSGRLSRDLQHLQQTGKVNLNDDYAKVEQTSIHEQVQARAHVLVAYAWIMYMAIFSGGRWIRGQLADAGDDFWAADNEKHSLDVPGFTFLSFSHTTDGEELKSAFKASLTLADGLLTSGERQDIVRASQALFQHCIDMIKEIDRDVLWYETTSNWYLAFGILGTGLLWLLLRSSTGHLFPG